MAMKPVSVSQLNSYIKRLLQSDPIISNIGVTGEISNLTKHSSGHWYFALKDAGSRVNCFLPAERVRSLRYEISEGMQITAYGYVSVYERGGYYSLNIRDIQAEGEGSLKQAFENLKKKLGAEGLFDEDKKRSLPERPRRIGVVTSPTGAAVKDKITTVKRRNPFVDVLIYPCLVQGEGSAASVCGAIEQMNRLFPELDLLIVGRGGGSAEDLWTFNEEAVARAVRASKIPVISAVGHEQDVVISDLAADLRAATPTAAAELAVPDIAYMRDRLERNTPQRLFAFLYDNLEEAQRKADRLIEDAGYAAKHLFDSLEHRLELAAAQISALDPLSVLSKGYAAVKKGNSWLGSAKELEAGDHIELTFSDGRADCLVERRELADE
jgi:exodeoxyribonuclease VII large subunit